MSDPVTQLVQLRASDVFGAAVPGTIIKIEVASTEESQLSFSGIGISRDPGEQAIIDGVQRTRSIVTNRTVDRSLAVPPTIRINAGASVSILSTRRIFLELARE